MTSLPLTIPRVPRAMIRAVGRQGLRPTRFLLVVSIAAQKMFLFQRADFLANLGVYFPAYLPTRTFLISTSAYGIGQVKDSNKTPLGLHRIARKIGAGHLPGTVFRSREPIGFTWDGKPDGTIVHRILWLEGLEPGFNQGGNVDTFERYVYIHGFGDESTLGRPNSHGCIHLAAADLMPLFDLLPPGTLVWIKKD